MAPERDALAAAFPRAAPRLVVFVHGLMETEHAWRLGGRESYGERLARELGCTPVEVRYNSGRHISEQRPLARRAAGRVPAAWPVEAEQIALVGHSMGGLVARSACHQAAQDGQAWAGRVRHSSRSARRTWARRSRRACTTPRRRSTRCPRRARSAGSCAAAAPGIRDLRQGSLVDRDWEGRDPDALRAAACEEVPLLAGATHCFVTATVTRDARHPVGRLIGDALVLSPSASGRGRTRRIPFRAQDGLHVGGAHHLALLNHPAVYAQLRDWLCAESSSGRAAAPRSTRIV